MSASSLRLPLLLILMLMSRGIGAQTSSVPADDPVSVHETTDSATPNADDYHEAKARAEALEREGAWADALQEWEEAFGAVERALFHAEFGTTPTRMGMPPNRLTLPMPNGFEHQREVRDRAMNAAHRSGNAAAAIRWARRDRKEIEQLEAQAREEGRASLADAYLQELLSQRIAAQRTQLAEVRRRASREVTLLTVYELALLIVFGLLVARNWNRRPRFTYLERARHVRSLPAPAFDWRPTLAAAAGTVFGLAVVAWLLAATVRNAGDTAGVVLLVVSVLATGVTLWTLAFAVTHTAKASRRQPKSVKELDPVTTEGLSELKAWFDANAWPLCIDFGVGRFRRGRLDRTVPAIADPVLRSALAAWLGAQLASRSTEIPTWLDEHVAASITIHPPGAWAPFVEPYVTALSASRRETLLADLSPGGRVVLGQQPAQLAHTGPIAQWLELAMVSGRRWSVADWSRRFQDAALATSVSSVVWGAFDGTELVRSFRVDGEGGLVTLGFETLERRDLGGLSIGVAHAVELDAADRRAWEQELGDFETVCLFDQLGRDVATPQWQASGGRQEGARFAVDIPRTAASTEELLDRGWIRRPDGLHRHLHPFGLTAQVRVGRDDRFEWISFYAGYHDSYESGVPVEPDRVSPIAVSEVRHELWSVC